LPGPSADWSADQQPGIERTVTLRSWMSTGSALPAFL
jgi:hypothetical protein